MITVNGLEYIGMGCFLKERRKALGISRDTLASNMDISTDLLIRWENEDLDLLDLCEIKSLARLLKYCPMIFIDGLPRSAYENWDEFINQKYIRNS